jgi:DNA-binding GntR family transcriptional regulator
MESLMTLSLPEQIARRLSDAITLGRYRPGEALGEQAISDAFEVSRAPVREALRILERDGVVQIIPRKGARVAILEYEDLMEASEVRAHLFELAASRFATAHSQEALQKYALCLDQLSALVDCDNEGRPYAMAAGEATFLIIDNCGNKRLQSLLHRLDFQVSRYRAFGAATKELRIYSLSRWKRLLKAFKQGDPEAAKALVREMNVYAQRAIARSFGRLGDARRDAG